MDRESKIRSENIIRSSGLNESEKYLVKLCNTTFLSLWSYPNLYKEKGKELCDLLVVFGNDILIFSDKTCDYPSTGKPDLDWSRWFKRAVEKSANQLLGAERWIRQYPKQIFLDKNCEHIFPFDIDTKKANIHLISVARGVSQACKKYLGGSGSLMIRNTIKGIAEHTEPFVIGDIYPSKTFIHVLDDTTLDIVMGALDTVFDFVSYISKKEILFRSGKGISVTGEEDLLPSYMAKMKGEEHDFDFPGTEGSDFIAIMEGTWESFCNNPQRQAQIKEDKVSYFWDDLIEQFNVHAINGTQYIASAGGIKDTEKTMHFFASESRFKRRVLSKELLGLVEKTPENICGRKFSIPLNKKGTYYAFIAFPKTHARSEEDYRVVRSEYLKACCMIVKAVYPEAMDIIGFATESGKDWGGRSEDAIYLDGRHWNEELQKEAKELQQKLDILTELKYRKVNELEFPDITAKSVDKVGRNEKCPCGSGMKYKRCHGR